MAFLRLNKFSFFLVLCAAFPAGLDATEAIAQEGRVELTAPERQWLAEHPVIRVAPDPDYPPIESVDKNGQIVGMSADYLKLLEKKLGIRFEIVALSSWDQAISMARSREVDMLSAATKSSARSEYLSFTTPHIEMPGVIIVHSNAGDFSGLDQFRGKRVGVVSSYVWQEWIARDYPGIILRPVRDMQTGLQLTSFGQLDAMVGNLATATHYIAKLGITNLRVTAETGYFARLALASRKDWPELNAILQKGIAAIGPDEKQAIHDRWIKLGTSTRPDSRTILLGVLIVIGVVAMAVGGTLFWNYSLRQMVRRQSASLRESEARVRLLLDSTGEAIYGLDLEGNCIFANPACLGMLGYRDTGDLLGRNMHDLIHHTRPDGTSHPNEECRIYLAFREGQSIHVDDEILWRKDGTSFWAEYWSYPMERDGQVVGSVVTFLDITERNAAEERLRRAQKMEVVGQLTGGIAHDFNNLLTAALANLELLGEGVSEDRRLRGLAEAAITAVERGSDLTQRLLTFASNQELRTETMDLNGLVQGMDNLLRRTLGEDIEIVTVLCPDLGMCRADSSQAKNAILNLAINAREAMPDGGTLKIETGNVEFGRDDVAANQDITPGQYVVVSVTDTGRGMTPEVAERAFDPFFTTRELGKGTGLGLGMVYGFVKQSGGRVEIESEPGRGTTVRFYLPRTAAEKMVEDVGPAMDEELEGEGSILVVDDDEAVRTGTVLLLESLGYEVVAAEDGPSALARLEEGKKFDLLFTDVVMPGGMSGPQLAGQVNILHPDIKIIFATGFGVCKTLLDEVTSHGAPVLRKPYHLRELALAVRNVIDGDGEEG